MKISGRKSNQIGPLTPLGGGAASEASSGADESAAIGGDSVSLETLKHARELQAAVRAMPTVRTEKVEGLREQIDDGSYYVESEKLARRVVNEALSDALINQMDRPALD